MRHLSLRSVLCIFIALLAGQALAQDAIKLEYKFVQGDSYRYKVAEKAAGNQKIEGFTLNSVWEGVLTLRVLEVLPDGGAKIEASYESGTLRMAGQTRKIAAGEAAPMTITVSKDGTIADFESLGSNPGWTVTVEVKTNKGGEQSTRSSGQNVYQGPLRAIFSQFPDRELKQGEKWKQDVLAPTMSGTVPSQNELKSVNASRKEALILRSIDEKASGPTGDDSGSGQPPSMSMKEKTKITFLADQGRTMTAANTGVLQMKGLSMPTEGGKTLSLSMTISYLTGVTLVPVGAK